MEDVHVRGLSCVKIREVHPEVMPSRLRPEGWRGGRPKGSWEGVPAERREHWKITEARTSGKVREEEKFRPCMGADVWQGTRLMSPGVPLPRGSGEQGTGRVLVLDISGPEQGIWQGALRNTEQSAGIGHILKGTERKKNKSPFERGQADVKCSQQVKEEGIWRMALESGTGGSTEHLGEHSDEETWGETSWQWWQNQWSMKKGSCFKGRRLLGRNCRK